METYRCTLADVWDGPVDLAQCRLQEVIRLCVGKLALTAGWPALNDELLLVRVVLTHELDLLSASHLGVFSNIREGLTERTRTIPEPA